MRIAYEYDCGLEIQIFSNPRILDDDWRSLLHKYRAMLKGFGGPLACHGAFYDLSPASMDARVVALTRDRYLLNLDIAAELEASPVVFHTNFFPMIRTEIYRRQWIASQAEFWSEMGQEAAKRGIEIAIENMWDPDPYVLRDLLEKIAVPNVACCMDVSHVYLYGDDKGQEIRNWLTVLEPY
ncbi:MAG: TIM barrel protein, partial [Anaerolineae bacterium]